MDAETEAYLAKVRKTITESKRMIETVKLRFAETDRLLEESGTTREEVMKMRFSKEQLAAVNAELERRGLTPLAPTEARETEASAAIRLPESDDARVDGENRRRKFATMMKPFRL
jgi:hypothetical protein